jgi:hypothetical protein
MLCTWLFYHFRVHSSSCLASSKVFRQGVWIQLWPQVQETARHVSKQPALLSLVPMLLLQMMRELLDQWQQDMHCLFLDWHFVLCIWLFGT